MYWQNSVAHHHFGSCIALVQVEMVGAEAVKEEPVKFVLLGKVLTLRLNCPSLVAKSEEVPNSMNIVGILSSHRQTILSILTSILLGIIGWYYAAFHPLADKVHVAPTSLQCGRGTRLELCKPRLCTTSMSFWNLHRFNRLPSMVADRIREFSCYENTQWCSHPSLPTKLRNALNTRTCE